MRVDDPGHEGGKEDDHDLSPIAEPKPENRERLRAPAESTQCAHIQQRKSETSQGNHDWRV
jgi:hypothetical protein